MELSVMNKYIQFVETIGNDAGASNKARADVATIATKKGFQKMMVNAPIIQCGGALGKVFAKVQYTINLYRAAFALDNDSTLMVQVPFINRSLSSHNIIRKRVVKKKCKLFLFVHDINEIRDPSWVKQNKSFNQLLNVADKIISHNANMTKYLLGKGLSRDKIVDLEVFDYLIEDYKSLTHYSKCVYIAGNLDQEKSHYLSELFKLKKVKFELYGPNYNIQAADNIHYNGIVKSSELPNLLNRGFGLVWDGDTIETCKGPFGEYLRYNNPHKLSLYLASGIPVIIWGKAAEAKFVQENNLGIVVDSLYELEATLEKIDEDKYKLIIESVDSMREKICTGYFASKAISALL